MSSFLGRPELLSSGISASRYSMNCIQAEPDSVPRSERRLEIMGCADTMFFALIIG